MTDLAARRAAVAAALRAAVARARTDYVFVLGIVLALASIAAIVQTVGTAVSRMSYPFVLEWMEGGIMDHVRMVLAGKPIYREPSFAWTPMIYTPLYYWVCAAFMKLFGVSLFWARFVSTCSFVGCLALIAQTVRKEIGGVVGPLVGAGLFAISFPLTGAWVDLARVDSLFFVLFLGGVYLARHGTTRVSAGAAGALLFLAFFAKQTALVMAMPVVAGAIVLAWRRGLVLAGVFAGLVIGAVQWMDLASEGWFRFYVFDLPRKHSLPPWSEWPHYGLTSLWEPMPVAVALALAALVSGAIKGWRVVAFYGSVFVVSGVAGFLSLVKNGGFVNAMIPYCGVIGVLAGSVVGWSLRQKSESPSSRRIQAAVAAVLMLQLVVLGYDQRKYVPRRRDVASGNAMIERWKKLRASGEVYSFGFDYYGMLAGSDEIHAHSMALADVARGQDTKPIARLMNEGVAAVTSHRYRTILWDESATFLPPAIVDAVKRHYVQQGSLFGPGEEDRTWPRTGFGARPNQIWVAR